MAGWRINGKLLALLKLELHHLTTIQPSDRPWQMPFAAGLACGLPMLIGAWLDHLDYGLVSSLGGLVFLYLPATALSHRMVWLMACAFGMVTCYTLGILGHFVPLMLAPTLTLITVLVAMVCRFYRLGPPSSMFFVMAAAIGAYTPTDFMQIPLHVGLLAMGCLLACAVGFVYSLIILRLRAPLPVNPLPPADFDHVVVDSVVIGVFVGLSLLCAQALALERAYWVPVSCLTVVQGLSLRAVWVKQLHRILGTALGLLLSLGLLSLPLDKWTIALLVIALSFVIETAVVRHYGFAVIFITPLTLLLAEAATLGQSSPAGLLQARFLDTVLGCLVGLVGGVCLHHPPLRSTLGRQMRRLLPSRLRR